jgi:hypothetical protein
MVMGYSGFGFGPIKAGSLATAVSASQKSRCQAVLLRNRRVHAFSSYDRRRLLTRKKPEDCLRRIGLLGV